MNKIYKVIRHQANSSGFELGSYSSCEKAEEALQRIVNCSPRFDPLRCNPMEFYEIKEYPFNLIPPDIRHESTIRSLYFDYTGNFISEYISVCGVMHNLYFGHIDCGQRLEVFENSLYQIKVWDEETEGQEIYATLYLWKDRTYADYDDRTPLSDEQLRAVMNLLKGPCRNKRFKTNWDCALMRWSSDKRLLEGTSTFLNLENLRKGEELPDTEEFIRKCNYKHK